MKIKTLILSFLVQITLLNTNLAQRVYNYNLSGSDCYSEMIFEETAIDPKGIIVLDVNGEDIVSFANNNPFVQSGLFSRYNFLYINILTMGVLKRPNVMM